MAGGYSSVITIASVLVSPGGTPTLRFMAGKCGFAFCICPGFDAPVQELAAEKLSSTKCPKCDHLLSDHGQATSPLATSHDPESVQERTSHKEKGHALHFVSRRTDTVRILAELVDRENIVHVWGTPASGKTTLARLLQQYYENQERTVYFIGNNWKKLETCHIKGKDDPWMKLNQIIRNRFNLTGCDQDLPAGTVIMIDEAQDTYSDTELWGSVIKERIYGKGEDIKFCLFCSYGSPSTGVNYEPAKFTPGNFTPSQRVTLTPQSPRPSDFVSPPSIGLFFTTDEFQDAVQQICADRKRFEVGFKLDNDAKDYLFSLTNGHPGGVESLLSFFYDYYRGEIKHGKISSITRTHVVDSLRVDERVWRYLRTTPVYRSFPKASLLSVQGAMVLRHVLEQGSIPVGKKEDITMTDYDQTDLEEGKKQCFVNGWLHKTLVPEDRADKEIYVLPSRLHEKWAEWILGEQEMRLNSKYNSLRELCVDILKEFSAVTLHHTAAGKVLTSAAQYKPLEAAYQDEFYRCFNKIAGRGVPICSEWSRTKDGRVDFWIPEKKWAVELLREGDRVHEHISRFYQGGRYHSWIADGMISDWIIINCATSRPIRCYSEPNLMHAVFTSSWKELQIFDNRKPPIDGKYPLKK